MSRHEGNDIKKRLVLGALSAAALALSPAVAADAVWTAEIAAIRQTAAATPGAKPLRVNVVKFAESRRTKNFAVKGAPTEPSIQARTAFQVVYPDGYVMIDSGMDEQVHKFFGRGAVEPYFPDVEQRVAAALRGAKSIVVTHEHGDHVAGVLRTPFFAELAPKTTLTKTQIATLENEPQMPEIKITADVAAKFKVIDYDRYFSYAPGIALVKAPGHTPGSQMIFVTLASGREYLFAGDVAWHMDGVRQMRGKDAPWITEPADMMAAELTWLNGVMKDEKNVVIVISHDEDQRLDYIRQGLLGDGLQ
jgi:glyoxylase-like metal-dependent hydrolase (beta-lactamase superfamily II)